jgi:zinc D-Ala-D-Ala carboxypeptidase
MSNIKLSKNFRLSEFTKSQTASRFGLNNNPSPEVVENLKLLCEKVLQPIRDEFNQPVIISSGYRSWSVNNRVGGSKSSQHLKGQAADFEIPSIDNYTLAKWIESHLNYDQLILEFYEGGNSGWIHVGYSTRHINQELTINRWGVFQGLKKY